MGDPLSKILEKLLREPLDDGDVAALCAGLEVGVEGAAGQIADLLHRLSVLVEVNRAVAEAPSLDALLPQLIQVVKGILHAERATLFLYDEAHDELFSRTLEGGDVSEIRLPAGAGIAGEVFATKAPVVIADAYADPRFNPEVDKRTGWRTRNILCVPLVTRAGATIGVTQVLNRIDGEFSDDDAGLLGVITTQAAAALEQAQLLEDLAKARDDEAILREVSATIAGDLDLDQLLAKVMHAATLLLEAERSTLFIHDHDSDELWSRVAEGVGPRDIRIPANAGIAGEAFTSARMVIIPDAYADPRFNPAFDKRSGFKTRSILCAPILDKLSRPIAVVQVLNKIGGAFTKRDEARLEAFSSQVAVALENARLFHDVLDLKNYNEGILRSLSNGVLTLDAELTVSKVNDAVQRVLGRGEDDLIGRQASDVFADDNAWIVNSLDYVRRTGGSDYHADTELRGTGSARSVNLTVAPLIDIDGQSMGYMLVFEDITSEKRIRNTMSRYLAKEVVDKVLEAGEGSFIASNQNATVLFSDIRRFTHLAADIGPDETVHLLNDYFSEMVEVVLAHRGMLDKYIGDGLMAVFGAPITDPHDADNAVTVSVEMMRALRTFNDRRAKLGETTLRIGIGIATGDVVAGSVGSEKRMDYTVIGDSVNLAARLENANKFFGTSILVSGMTIEQLSTELPLREIDLIRVKNRPEPVKVYEPLGYLAADRIDELSRELPRYTEGLALYRERRWSDAQKCFAEIVARCPQDGPSQHFADRCTYYRDFPPDETWDGVWSLTGG